MLKRSVIGQELLNELYLNRFVIYNGLFYKRSVRSEEKMNLLHIASSNFFYDVYILANQLLYGDDLTNNQVYIGFATNYYSDYKTIYEALVSNHYFNRDAITEKIILSFLDLINNGFLYTDFHHRNILVNGDNLLIADMDSVTKIFCAKKKDFIRSIWCMMDLIVEIYFYHDHIPNDYVLEDFMYQIEGKGIFNSRLREFLIAIINQEDCLPYHLEDMIDLIIKDFSDQEKNNKVKKSLHI